MKALYINRFRTSEDRNLMERLFSESGIVLHSVEARDIPFLLTDKTLHLDDVTLPRSSDSFHGSIADLKAIGCQVLEDVPQSLKLGLNVRPLIHQLPLLQLVARCVAHNWLPILVSFIYLLGTIFTNRTFHTAD